MLGSHGVFHERNNIFEFYFSTCENLEGTCVYICGGRTGWSDFFDRFMNVVPFLQWQSVYKHVQALPRFPFLRVILAYNGSQVMGLFQLSGMCKIFRNPMINVFWNKTNKEDLGMIWIPCFLVELALRCWQITLLLTLLVRQSRATSGRMLQVRSSFQGNRDMKHSGTIDFTNKPGVHIDVIKSPLMLWGWVKTYDTIFRELTLEYIRVTS